MLTICIIHIGMHLPHYIKDCIHQLRIHNPKESTDIVLILNGHTNYGHAIKLAEMYSIKVAYIEELPITPHYIEFLTHSQRLLKNEDRQNSTQYMLERHFIWEAYLLKTNLTNVYLVESDNLMYVPLNVVQKTESLFSHGIAMPFDSVDRGVPSIVFARDYLALEDMNCWIIECMKKDMTNDMDIYGLYRKAYPDKIFHYPVLPPNCNKDKHMRTNKLGQTALIHDCTFLCDERFPIIFDSFVYGQAISGIDPRNTNAEHSEGHINETALFSVSESEISWSLADQLWFPMADHLKIANLHIHSKALSHFLSDRATMPVADYNSKELLEKINTDYIY